MNWTVPTCNRDPPTGDMAVPHDLDDVTFGSDPEGAARTIQVRPWDGKCSFYCILRLSVDIEILSWIPHPEGTSRARSATTRGKDPARYSPTVLELIVGPFYSPLHRPGNISKMPPRDTSRTPSTQALAQLAKTGTELSMSLCKQASTMTAPQTPTTRTKRRRVLNLRSCTRRHPR